MSAEAVTNQLRKLHNIPDSKRDDDWYETLFDTLPQGHYALFSTEPQKAPDGFHYYFASLLDKNADLKSREIISLDEETLSDCLNRGVGVVIFADSECRQDPLWILSYGELHSFYLYENFSGDPEDLEEMIEAEENGMPQESEISVDKPDDEFIHPGAREVLKKFFGGLGFEGVEMAMLRDPSEAPSRSLVLSLHEDDFSSPGQLEEVIQTVSWLLPPHRPVILDGELEGEFFPLA